MIVWNFFRDDGTTGEGRIKVKVGETMRVSGEIIPCFNGLHGSVRAIDALQYAPGAMIQRAKLGGTIVAHGDPVDKHAASERTCLAMADATETLRYFARWCALSVIDQWDAPQVVLDYLMTGDEKLRDAAWATAWDAAWATARAAARAAARATAGAAARAAAWDAAGDAARATARAAARAAARATAGAAARATARAAARAAQNTELERLLNELLEVA